MTHDNVVSIGRGSAWTRFWLDQRQRLLASKHLQIAGLWRLCRLMAYIASPVAELNQCLGRENFHFPSSKRLLKLQSKMPDILHCHNLHGSYFDLRQLPKLSARLPVCLTLHDAWMLSGHCAHSFNCDRWVTGCGQCPDLTIYPAIAHDATAYNWLRKERIFKRSRLYVVTPSTWLMKRVQKSMLVPGIVKSCVIPNGVDLAVFMPGNKKKARELLSISNDTKVLLFMASAIKANIWKDYQMMRSALSMLTVKKGQKILFLAVGENAPCEQLGSVEIRYVPYQHDVRDVSQYYQVADIYLHAARADTFPTSVLEALACGTPVVATAVGGIPEQVKALNYKSDSSVGIKYYEAQDATGILVAPGDASSMRDAIQQLLANDQLRQQLGENAAKDAIARFSLDTQVANYLKWYDEIRQSRSNKK